jgi:hypothetical protein
MWQSSAGAGCQGQGAVSGRFGVRGLMILLLGAIIGAAGFHLYYLRLDAHARCRWDHPSDRHLRDLCEAGGAGDTQQGYGKPARQELDRLIGKISH